MNLIVDDVHTIIINVCENDEDGVAYVHLRAHLRQDFSHSAVINFSYKGFKLFLDKISFLLAKMAEINTCCHGCRYKRLFICEDIYGDVVHLPFDGAVLIMYNGIWASGQVLRGAYNQILLTRSHLQWLTTQNEMISRQVVEYARVESCFHPGQLDALRCTICASLETRAQWD